MRDCDTRWCCEGIASGRWTDVRQVSFLNLNYAYSNSGNKKIRLVLAMQITVPRCAHEIPERGLRTNAEDRGACLYAHPAPQKTRQGSTSQNTADNSLRILWIDEGAEVRGGRTAHAWLARRWSRRALFEDQSRRSAGVRIPLFIDVSDASFDQCCQSSRAAHNALRVKI